MLQYFSPSLNTSLSLQPYCPSFQSNSSFLAFLWSLLQILRSLSSPSLQIETIFSNYFHNARVAYTYLLPGSLSPCHITISLIHNRNLIYPWKHFPSSWLYRASSCHHYSYHFLLKWPHCIDLVSKCRHSLYCYWCSCLLLSCSSLHLSISPLATYLSLFLTPPKPLTESFLRLTLPTCLVYQKLYALLPSFLTI